ncbi:hypothetical protein [Streptomyces albipurpureus]|uniref:Secreted protein n=1 Tax=Streptomyces albipurpureus TaxID=2897419 RepID=A0ABT0UW44_9ACTN|nr:hypothetical protein [Streptomyces sp. CWNU-1]MCM2391406.1 hypothetical protein [Streptomyces sp. CWNU-1]
MASIRTARVLAAAAALPLTVALFSGVATAADPILGDGSNATVAAIVGSGVGGANLGNSTTGQQVASGDGASAQSNIASVNGSAFTVVDQTNAVVNFTNLW